MYEMFVIVNGINSSHVMGFVVFNQEFESKLYFQIYFDYK